MVRAEFLGQLGPVAAATVYRNDLESHAARVLDAEVAQPADSENSDQVPGARRRIPQRAECGQTGAQQWCGIDR